MSLLAARLGRPADAVAHLREAQDIAERCGNDIWARQAEADLAAVG